ncbi:MAG: ATP-binding cassette domain-containing protein [Deltaproteobacteria bacterium]|nr:ATP-binding cassette domain-containing protein [Deltaproteobacteria bacterium]HDM10141.1 ATP-binding cassette domain-containing protein [Desulfobacteraceae bacterium]
MSPFLSLQELECQIASTSILRSCSLDIEEREIVCLLGRNGAGKSSILKSIIGLYPLKRGSISFTGRDITRIPCHERVLSGIAYAPEDSRLFPDLTVQENIQLGFWIIKETQRSGTFDFDKIFEIFPPVKRLLRRKAGTLSGGEKKMVSISRALALCPFLLLLDESFEGLSPLVVATLSNAMLTIRDELGVSILLAESNVHNASQVAERAYIIDRGEIIFEGHPSEILSNEELIRLVGK